MTALVEPPSAISSGDRVVERGRRSGSAPAPGRRRRARPHGAPVALGGRGAARVDRRDRGGPGQRHAERLDHAGHRRRGAELVAVAVADGISAASSSAYSAFGSRPARYSAVYSQRSVPTPSSRPRKKAGCPGPPVSMIAGTPALAAPISCAGTVLSQPGEQHDRVERMGADRLLDVHRHQVAIEHRGRLHQVLAQARSSGTRAAGRRPRARRACTAWASPRRCRLQWTSSDHELQMPTTGRPSIAAAGEPLGLDRGPVEHPDHVVGPEPAGASQRAIAVGTRTGPPPRADAIGRNVKLQD